MTFRSWAIARIGTALAGVVGCLFLNPVYAAPYFGEDNARTLVETGCNAATYVQLPGEADFFVGRHFFKADGSAVTPEEKCASEGVREAVKANRWGLVLDRLNWKDGVFSIVKPLLVPPLTIPGGPIQGAVLKTAYDPNIVVFRGQGMLFFECIVDKAKRVQGTSSCMAVFDLARKEIRPETIHVVVSGQQGPEGGVFHAASVPTPLVFNNRLYLYWSELDVDHGKFARIAVRGAELDVGSRGLAWVKGANGQLVYTIGPETVEVWGPEANDPMSNTAVDIKSVWVSKTGIVAVAGLGGSGCAGPGPQRGCFRMGISRADQPLGDHIFNHAGLLDVAMLPTNAQGYTRPIKNPDGGYSFVGVFFKPTANGFSELRPVPRDWNKLEGLVEVTFPIPDQSLWPVN